MRTDKSIKYVRSVETRKFAGFAPLYINVCVWRDRERESARARARAKERAIAKERRADEEIDRVAVRMKRAR